MAARKGLVVLLIILPTAAPYGEGLFPLDVALKEPASLRLAGQAGGCRHLEAHGEEATLERMHISIGQSILRSPGCNVLDAAGFSAEEQAVLLCARSLLRRAVGWARCRSRAWVCGTRASLPASGLMKLPTGVRNALPARRAYLSACESLPEKPSRIRLPRLLSGSSPGGAMPSILKVITKKCPLGFFGSPGIPSFSTRER